MKKRLIALLLCLVMLVTCMGVGVFMPPDIKLLSESGEEVSSVSVPQSDRVQLTTDYKSSGELGYQWQLSADGKTWINIYGQTGESVQLSYAMVCNMLNDEGTVQVRCMVTDGESEYASRAAEVSVDYSAPAQSPKQAAPAKASAVQNDAAPQADETGTSVITINYVYQSGAQAANPWTATIPEGETLVQTVESPSVVGYEPDKQSVEVDSSVQTNYTVTYYPADVNFTVKHYLQNISNDEYTLDKTENKTGKTESAVGGSLAGTYTGFTALLYDTETKVAADGSTVVEIYYDRNYYLLSLDLDGGYGAEPMYARYGTDINIADPTKAGYTFAGWKNAKTEKVESLPATMPADNTSYIAQWRVGDTAKVTVVIWGENANDEGDSLITSYETTAKPGDKLQLDESTAPITSNTLESFGLKSDTPTVDPDEKNWWGQGKYGDGDAATHFEGKCSQCPGLTNLKSGSVCFYNDNGKGDLSKGTNYYFLYLDGKYYEITSDQYNSWKTSDGVSVRHGRDTYAVYTARSDLWQFKKSDEITVAADGSSIINVYYDRKKFTLTFKYNYSRNQYQSTETVTAKWGADISEQTKAVSSRAKSSYWSATEDGEQPYTNHFEVMPTENATYYNRGKNGGTGSMVYWGEDLNGEYTVKLFQEDNVGGYYVTDEDRYEFTGFTYHHGTANEKECAGAKFYYTRNSYTLSFYNHNKELTDRQISVKYEANLNEKTFDPAYPDGLEPGAYRFEGWYTDQFFHNKVTDATTMPASDVMLYAKWTPKTHTVKTWLTDKMDTPVNVGDSNVQNILHREKASKPSTPTNGNYTFVGWFYMENGVEKAFDFSMPVTKDLDLYAKWSSNTLVQYTIKYTLEDGTVIAPPTNGSALAGTTKTFNAKSGNDLNEGYRTGYFPKTSSHSVTMDINGGNEYTFVYVEKTKVNYTVKYLEKGTGNVLADEEHRTTSAAVITEQFKPVKGYAPDAYQKKLVLSADDTANVIIFWYTKDEVHAPVQIIHWIQNVSGNDYTEYQSSTNLNAVIGKDYTANELVLRGFVFNEGKSNPTGTLDANGLVLNMYYDRIAYPYEFRFLEQGSNKQLADPTKGNGLYEARVSENAKNIPGYELVSAESQTIAIAIEDPADTAKNNVKVFYYKEKTVDIKYEIVGPADCGSLTKYVENVNAINGSPEGSTARVANNTYKFVGWYLDKDCTKPVPASWVSDDKITPAKSKDYGSGTMGYEAATYYAKFDYNVVDLTITKTISDKDSKELYGERSFVFHVKGTDENTEKIDIDVVVKIENGETSGSVVLKALPIGRYTITEDTGWSWRYECKGIAFNGATLSADSAAASCTLVGGANNEVTFTNSWLHAQWLSFTTSVRNIFGTQNNK